MHYETERQAAEDSVAKAIRAVEGQLLAAWANADGEAKEEAHKFFELLDARRRKIFLGIADAARAGQRKFYLGTIRNFNSDCDKIFQSGLGHFDVGMLNAWLYSRDLKHLFSGAIKAIEW